MVSCKVATIFYSILESYSPEMCIFFTLIGETRFALHEMYEVSGLVMEDIPYEEYIPSMNELYLMKKDAPLVYKIYWKVLCHFHIYAETSRLMGESDIWPRQTTYLKVWETKLVKCLI